MGESCVAKSSRKERRTDGSPRTSERSSGAKTTVRTMPRISRGLTCARLMRARFALPRTISSSMTCSRPEVTTRARMTAPPGAASSSSRGMRTSAPSAPTLCDENVDR